MSLQRINISRVAAVAVLVAVCVLTASVAGQDDQKLNNRNSQSLSGSSSASFGAAGSSPNNDIYIDDEGLEGSGSRGEIRDDLEKEDDESSGSGYGDDDEDSSSISNSRSNSNSNVGILGGGGGQGQGQGGQGGNNNQLGGGGQGGSGDHADYDDEDDREDDDLYTETKNPNSVDPSTTDDEDMSTGTGKDGKSSSGGTSIKHSPDGDLEISQTQHITPTNGEGGAGGSGGTGHDSTNNNNNAYGGSGVLIMNAKNEDRTASFFAQPGILAAVIGGAVVGLLCAILVVMFIVYRMRKKDEGSYALDEPKRSPTANTYAKNANNREFYA